MMENYEKVKREIKKSKNGCTITDLAKHVKLTRNTARVYIEKAIGEGLAEIQKVGNAKLIKPKFS